MGPHTSYCRCAFQGETFELQEEKTQWPKEEINFPSLNDPCLENATSIWWRLLCRLKLVLLSYSELLVPETVACEISSLGEAKGKGLRMTGHALRIPQTCTAVDLQLCTINDIDVCTASGVRGGEFTAMKVNGSVY